MIKSFFISLLLWLPFGLFAQIPPGYYDNAQGLSGQALKAALHDIIDGHTSISYTAVTDALKVLDEDPDNSDNLILIYKQTSLPKSDFGTGADDWNREHVWPKSHGDFGTTMPTGTDLFNLRPADASVNNSRGEKDFDDCQATGTQHPEATQCYYTTDAWEPPDAVKGDIARAIFYMEVRYEGDNGEVDLEMDDQYTSTSSSPGYLGVRSTLLQWHEDDPVDNAEQARNNTIYNNYQANRNPFIDHPEYAGYIWGSVIPEPTNHATGFSSHCITLRWDDATGSPIPDGYLIRMSETGFEDITIPADGQQVSNDFYNKNVSFEKEICIFGSLTPGKTYYFKIFGYTGSGSAIDYKTDGNVQQVSGIAK
jgi:endonuclease I